MIWRKVLTQTAARLKKLCGLGHKPIWPMGWGRKILVVMTNNLRGGQAILIAAQALSC